LKSNRHEQRRQRRAELARYRREAGRVLWTYLINIVDPLHGAAATRRVLVVRCFSEHAVAKALHQVSAERHPHPVRAQGVGDDRHDLGPGSRDNQVEDLIDA